MDGDRTERADRVYGHTQRGTLIVWVLFGIAIAEASIFFAVLRGAPMAAQATAAGVLAFFIVLLWLFRSLSVEVTPAEIRLWFGPGLIHKSFRTADVVEVEPVRNHWYYGWGIRLTPHGWLFNISGLDAVQIRLQSGRCYRIGTDQPRELAAAIASVIGQARG